MADAIFGVLGPVRARHATGRHIRLSGRQRAVLATVLLNVNTTVSRDRLIAAVWDDPPPSAVANLQTYVAQLRRALQPEARLHTSGAGYLFEAAPDELDLLLFEDEVRRARVESDPAAAARRLEHALALWRGRPAEDASLGNAMTPRLTELEERLADVRADWADLRLQLGMHDEVIGALRVFVAEQPLRERAWQQLMLALARSGRRAEALETYRQARETLVTELGIEPGPELRLLQAAVLSGTPSANRPEQRGAICQLPADIADFVGRSEELTAITTLLRPEITPTALPIVTVTGPPGVGKSTLAVRAAHLLREDFPDGQLYLRLSGASPAPQEPGALLAELLRALRVEGDSIPDTVAERAALYRSLLADKAVLVVLDDAADGLQVAPLLPGTPRCAVLVTSRGPLIALPGAVAVSLGVPPEREARELLESVAGGSRVRDEPDAARAILHACGRLPLAVRIAGARLAARPAWSLKDLAARLAVTGAPLDELALGGQNVRAHFVASYEVLSAPARRAFRLLGLAGLESAADWSVAALMGVPRREAESAVETLALAGLVTANEVDESGQPRYRMHDLLRAFARERAEAEESPAGRAAALLGFVEECLARVRAAALEYPPPMRPPMDSVPPPVESARVDGGWQRAWLHAERKTLADAVALAEPVTAAELAQRLAPFLVAHGFFAEAIGLLENVAERTGDTHTTMLIRLVRADILTDRRRTALAEPELRLLIDYFEGVGDRHAVAYALATLAICELISGRHESALTLVTRSLPLFEAYGDTNGLISALVTTSGIHLDRAEYDLAIATCRRGLELAADPRFADFAIRFRRVLGIAHFELGEVETAIGHYEASIEASRELGWGTGERMALRRLGQAYSELGRYELAATTLDRCAAMFAQAGDGHGQGMTFYARGEVSLKQDRPDEALHYFRLCLDQVEEPIWRARAAEMVERLRRDPA
ncbi:BTAD domain-containing putative transcriptional regulator [Nonomuraea sp. NPDC049028]|uniref:AfsR/SARP family transcriptional regulator n=1 Tax=Nonomuraea sp. NPDC049028 TaxID=3364348 RepID=UPI003713BBC7